MEDYTQLFHTKWGKTSESQVCVTETAIQRENHFTQVGKLSVPCCVGAVLLACWVCSTHMVPFTADATPLGPQINPGDRSAGPTAWSGDTSEGNDPTQCVGPQLSLQPCHISSFTQTPETWIPDT